jgi:undecaprenyl-diphosphatase
LLLVSQTQALVLGVVQGLTEFLPVSSSGHLVLGQKLLGLRESELLFDVVVHVGTLLAVAVYFHRDLWMMLRGLWVSDSQGRQGRRLILLVIVGSIPAGLAGFFLKDLFEGLFGSVLAVGYALCLTGCILVFTRWAGQGRVQLPECGPGRALLVGLAQALAITPGISRSGATIACGLLMGLERSFAARLSFMLSIPAILGALVLQLMDLEQGQSIPLASLFIGGISSALSGYVALYLLVKMVHKGSIHVFAPYCFALGGGVVIWSLLY